MYKDKVLTEIVQNTERGSIIFDNTIFEEVSQNYFLPHLGCILKIIKRNWWSRKCLFFNDGDKNMS